MENHCIWKTCPAPELVGLEFPCQPVKEGSLEFVDFFGARGIYRRVRKYRGDRVIRESWLRTHAVGEKNR